MQVVRGMSLWVLAWTVCFYLIEKWVNVTIKQ